LWQHDENLLASVQNKRVPFIDRVTLEDCVVEYLEMPFRSRHMDRVLIDGLVAAHLVNFSNDMMHGPEYANTAPLKTRHALTQFLLATAIDAVFFLGGSVFVLYVLPNWVGVVLALLLLGYFSFATIRNLIRLPKVWTHQARAKKTIIEQILDMNAVYSDLKTDRGVPISSQFVAARVLDTANKGTRWPAALSVLLDDINKRGGTF
jgi:hypothetical protein